MSSDFIGDLPVLDDTEAGPLKIKLPHKFKARRYQLDHVFRPFLLDKVKRIVAVWHRRAGKDKAFWNLLIAAASQVVGVYFYLLPEQNQARKVIWRGIDKDGVKFLDHIPAELVRKRNTVDMVIELTNGSIIQLGGSDNYNSMLGTNPRGIVFSEFSIQDPNAWEYFRPILAENGGWACFGYTPRGKNHGFKLANMAKQNPSWHVSILGADDTKAIPKEAIEEERRAGMSDQMIEQEFYVSFDAPNEQAVYGKEIRLAEKERRVRHIPIDPAVPLVTFWDLGISKGNQMALWVVQPVFAEIRLVGYYERSGEGIEHFVKWLKDFAAEHKTPLADFHYAPHDIKVRELFLGGRTRQQAALELGITFDQVPDIGLDNGIAATRRLFPRLFIDPVRCERGYEAISNYSYEWDDVAKCWLTKPKHDWSSNGCDALRMLAVAWDDKLATRKRPAMGSGPIQAKQQDSIFGRPGRR